MNRGKPNWEHLSEDLHVLITVEDTHNRAKIKLQRAINEVKKLLVPAVSISRTPSPLNIREQTDGKSGGRCTVLVCTGGGGDCPSKKCVFVSFCVSVCDSLCMREYV